MSAIIFLNVKIKFKIIQAFPLKIHIINNIRITKKIIAYYLI